MPDGLFRLFTPRQLCCELEKNAECSGEVLDARHFRNSPYDHALRPIRVPRTLCGNAAKEGQPGFGRIP